VWREKWIITETDPDLPVRKKWISQIPNPIHEKKRELSEKPNQIHVWKEMWIITESEPDFPVRSKWIITETEPDSRVKRKVNHHRIRTRFTCEIEVNHHRNRTRFKCEKKSESSQKPNSIYMWERSESSQEPNSGSICTNRPPLPGLGTSRVDPEADLSRHGTRINAKVKCIINCDLRWSTTTTTQRPISNYLRKTWPHKVTITATHVTNRTGCELLYLKGVTEL